MTDKQTKYELKVFKRFALVCELPIILESIEKRDPPEPDITCNVDGSGVLAFELTELIDRGFANLVGKQIETKKELINYYNELDKKVKQDFYRHYADAIMFIHFENSLSLRQRKKLFPVIFEHLLDLNYNFEGNPLQNDPKFKGKLKWITIKILSYISVCYIPRNGFDSHSLPSSIRVSGLARASIKSKSACSSLLGI